MARKKLPPGRIKPLPGLSDTSTSGLSEIWVPQDIAQDLGSYPDGTPFPPADLMVYLYGIEHSDNTTHEIREWAHSLAAQATGLGERVVSRSYTRLVKAGLFEPREKGVHPRVKVRCGLGRSSIRVPRVALWAGPLSDGPRWGKDSGDAARTIVAQLNRMDHHSSSPTMHYPHKVVSEKVGLASSVYRLGAALLADEPWYEVTKRWRFVGEERGPMGGMQQDSSEITFRWAVLRTAVEDRHALLALADAQKAHLAFANSAILSTKHVDPAAGEHVDFTAGEHVDPAASIFTYSCQHVLSPHVLSSSSSATSTSSSAAATAAQPAAQPAQPTSGEGGDQEEEPKKQALFPAPMPLTIANVINAKSGKDVEPILQAVFIRCEGWWPDAMQDGEWHAAVIAAIHWAPTGHAMKLTVAQAEQLAQSFLRYKPNYWTPHALAVALVGPSLNRDVRSPVAVLRARLDKIPQNAWTGSTKDPKALLTPQDMIPNQFAGQYRGEDQSTKADRVRGTKSTRPHMITGRDRSDGSTYSRTFDADGDTSSTPAALDLASMPVPAGMVRGSDGILRSTTFY